MSENGTYNGWTNNQTWRVALWLNTDYGLYQSKTEIVNRVMRGVDESLVDAFIVGELAAQLETFVSELFEWCPDSTFVQDFDNPLTDLLIVDWMELADSEITDYDFDD